MAAKTGNAIESVGILILRVGAGGLLLYGHGWAKLMHFSERATTFADPIGVGPAASLALVVLAEVFCAALVILGAWTRIACIPLVIFFLVAVFIQHAQDPLADKELAIVYLVSFATLLLTGGGRYSLDAVMSRLLDARRKRVGGGTGI